MQDAMNEEVKANTTVKKGGSGGGLIRKKVIAASKTSRGSEENAVEASE
jgi:hypothetical protein